MEQKFCQSCGMPVNEVNLQGTNADAGKNEDYCCYCYKEGAFTSDCTMEEMIENCLKYLEEFNKDSEIKYTAEEARSNMMQFFPQLKRWKKD